MTDAPDKANVTIPPPIAWALAFLAGLGIDWIFHLPFVPTSVPRAWVGGGVVALGVALAVWAVVTFRKAGTRVEPYKPTTVIVSHGPFAFTRNPIYLGMLLGQVGLAIGFDSLWILVMLVPLYLVLRYGVIAREESYLERKFGAVYVDYKSRTRRWL
jgi:protein-S-isoprenylcysteine O-methyltransferase Ste14